MWDSSWLIRFVGKTAGLDDFDKGADGFEFVHFVLETRILGQLNSILFANKVIFTIPAALGIACVVGPASG